MFSNLLDNPEAGELTEAQSKLESPKPAAAHLLAIISSLGSGYLLLNFCINFPYNLKGSTRLLSLI